ncbi:hypothetical protein [Streptomyces silvensis]|uniref:Uncharacterized protein n=1 Tax=Streptomyces silvensis TaxID=1765722 RepID=A0A0W7XB06_9ACTN|nr:hypothetical protein [Streptomyces silvensis]KUF20158.1 hypothetical protein AT728_40270 [Streptomyces silvensis]
MTTQSDPQTISVELADENGAYTLAATVNQLKRHQEAGLFGLKLVGLYAQLTITVDGEKAETQFLSRLVDESHWIIDDRFGANGFPFWAHGFGARYLRCHAIHPELADGLDVLARERGLAAAIGRDVPLALADA